MTLRLMMIRIGLKRSVANRYAFGFYLFGNLISIAVMFFLWQSVLRHRPSAVFAEP
ncbi:ABC transporter permease, partial [Lacticaseibacillus paracasei subsp. paracasei Lpp70]